MAKTEREKQLEEQLIEQGKLLIRIIELQAKVINDGWGSLVPDKAFYDELSGEYEREYMRDDGYFGDRLEEDYKYVSPAIDPKDQEIADVKARIILMRSNLSRAGHAKSVKRIFPKNFIQIRDIDRLRDIETQLEELEKDSPARSPSKGL